MHTVGILVFAGLFSVVVGSGCGHAGCNADGHSQETGSSMLQSRGPVKSQLAIMAESGERLSTKMGVDAESTVGKMLDRTMEMLLRAEGVGNVTIVQQVQEQLTITIKDALMEKTKAEKKEYNSLLQAINDLKYDNASIATLISETETAGETAKTCNATLTQKIENSSSTCEKSDDTKNNLVFPETCKVEFLKTYGREGSNGSSPVCMHFIDIRTYDNYYKEFATELKKCAETIKGLSKTSEEADNNCSDAKDAVTEQEKECNATDAKTVLKVCQASAKVKAECEAYSQEYDDKASNLLSTRQANQANIEKRQKEYEGLQLIMCFLESLAAEDTGVKAMDGWKECKDKTYDTSEVVYAMDNPNAKKKLRLQR